MKEVWKPAVIIVAVLIAAILSFFVAADYFTSSKATSGTMKSLKETRATVMKMTVVTAASSAAIAAVPGDVTTPVATKLADLSGYLVIILAAVYLEMCLLTLTGVLAFKLMIPIACGIVFLWVIFRRKGFLRAAAVIALMGIALYAVVPASVYVSNHLDSLDQTEIQRSVESAGETAENVEKASKSSSSDSGVLDKVMNKAKSIKDSAVEKAETVLGDIMDGIAKMIITACVIPILMLVLFLWIIKIGLNLLGISMKEPRKKVGMLTGRRSPNLQEKAAEIPGEA